MIPGNFKAQEYQKEVRHQKEVVEGITPKDLRDILYQIPESTKPADLRLTLTATNQALPGTQGELYFDRERPIIRHAYFPQDLTPTLRGGRIETLRVTLPDDADGRREFFNGGRMISLFGREPLEELTLNGYTINTKNFRLRGLIVRTGTQDTEDTAEWEIQNAGRLILTTEKATQGKREDLVFYHTEDSVRTREFETFNRLFQKVKEGKKPTTF